MLNSYGSDMLCIPLMLSSALFLIRKIHSESVRLSTKMIIFSVAYVSIIFEGILPLVSAKFTADGFDVLCYAVGGTIFYFFQINSIAQNII